MATHSHYDMRALAPTVAHLLGIRSPGGAEAGPVPEILAELGRPDRLAMVVLDAFGDATWEYARSVCPVFSILAEGHWLPIRAVHPPITPVNFATMATGASPSAHKVRARTDPLEMETIFHTLREGGRTSAAVGRALSTVGILLAPFADWESLASSNTDAEVLQLALQIVRERQPDYLLLQFLAVDDASHQHGPFTPENCRAVAETDARLRSLTGQLAVQGYALLLLADHGQHPAPPKEQRPGHLGTHDGSVEEDLVVPLIWAWPERICQALAVVPQESPGDCRYRR